MNRNRQPKVNSSSLKWNIWFEWNLQPFMPLCLKAPALFLHWIFLQCNCLYVYWLITYQSIFLSLVPYSLDMKEDRKTQKSIPASFSTVHNADLELFHTQLLNEFPPWWRHKYVTRKKVGTEGQNIRMEVSLGFSWLFQPRTFIRFMALLKS